MDDTRKQGSTANPIPFYLVSSVDGRTPQPGKTVTVTVSKNGGAQVSASGAITDRGNGLYWLAGHAADRDTVGDCVFRASATGCDDAMRRVAIVPADPFDANLGLSNLDVASSALLAALQNISNNTFVATTIPTILERPDSGSTTASIVVVFADETGTAKNLDSGSPALTLTNDLGQDLASRVGAWTNPATGKYVATYTNNAAHALEWLNWEITGTVNAKLRRIVGYTQLVDTSAVDFTNADRTKLNQLAADYTTDRAGKLDQIATADAIASASWKKQLSTLGLTSADNLTPAGILLSLVSWERVNSTTIRVSLAGSPLFDIPVVPDATVIPIKKAG